MKLLSLFHKYRKYINERFPLKLYGVYTLSLFSVSYFFSTTLIKNHKINIPIFLLGFCTVFLFFLQLRIFDEYKDYEEDKISHPERMLSKGEITLGELKILLYGSIALEIIMNIYMGIPQIIMWMVLCIYSIFMFKEFFCSSYLKSKPLLYIISHQIVIPLICLYSMSVHINFEVFNNKHVALIILFLSACICLTISIELVRKLKINSACDNSNQGTIEMQRNKINGLFSGIGLMVYAWIVFTVIFLLLHVPILFIATSTLLAVLYIIEGCITGVKAEPQLLKRLKRHNYLVVFGVFIISAFGFYFG